MTLTDHYRDPGFLDKVCSTQKNENKRMVSKIYDQPSCSYAADHCTVIIAVFSFYENNTCKKENVTSTLFIAGAYSKMHLK